jgi:hypothetical protein
MEENMYLIKAHFFKIISSLCLGIIPFLAPIEIAAQGRGEGRGEYPPSPSQWRQALHEGTQQGAGRGWHGGDDHWQDNGNGRNGDNNQWNNGWRNDRWQSRHYWNGYENGYDGYNGYYNYNNYNNYNDNYGYPNENYYYLSTPRAYYNGNDNGSVTLFYRR